MNNGAFKEIKEMLPRIGETKINSPEKKIIPKKINRVFFGWHNQPKGKKKKTLFIFFYFLFFFFYVFVLKTYHDPLDSSTSAEGSATSRKTASTTTTSPTRAHRPAAAGTAASGLPLHHFRLAPGTLSENQFCDGHPDKVEPE